MVLPFPLPLIYQDSDTPLHAAVSMGHTGTVELLLTKGAAVDAKDRVRLAVLYIIG